MSLQKAHHEFTLTESYLALWSWYYGGNQTSEWKWDTRVGKNYMNIDELYDDPFLHISTASAEEDEELWQEIKTEV